MTAAYGCDVSHYQSQISWSQVAAAGKAFAIIKATEGTTWMDARFRSNWAAARAAGLRVSAYHYFRPGLDPISQAQHFHAVVGDLAAGDLIPWVDVEDEHSSVGGLAVAPAVIVEQLLACLGECQRLFGAQTGVYTGRWFWDKLPHTGRFAQQPLWVAHWFVDQKPGGTFSLPSGWSQYAIHQYTSRGKVAGITGNVDLDWTPDLTAIMVGGGVDKTRAVIALLEQALALLRG